MRKLMLIATLLLFSFRSFSQDLENSNLIKETRKLYIDTLLNIYRGDIKGTVVLFSEELPVGFILPKTKNFILCENITEIFKKHNSKSNFMLDLEIEEITDTSLIFSITLVRKYRRGFQSFFSHRKHYIKPLVWLYKNDHYKYLENNYYMQFVYKYDCTNRKWILVPEKSYRNYQKPIPF